MKNIEHDGVPAEHEREDVKRAKAERDERKAKWLATLPEPTMDVADCTHLRFTAACHVARLSDVGMFSAEMHVRCLDCGLPFRFIGPDAGWSPTEPRVSIDGLVLFAPIEPELEKQLRDRASYVMPAVPARH